MKKIVLVVTLRTVQSLEKRIQDLKNILDLLDSTNDTLNGMKTLSKDTTWGKIFETISVTQLAYTPQSRTAGIAIAR